MKKLLILAFFTAGILFSLNTIEKGFTYDEAVYLSIGRNLSADFSDYTMNSKYMLYRPPALPYLIALASRFAGHYSEKLSTIITPFFSLLLMISFYLAVRRYYTEQVALLSALFLLLCPLYVRHSIRVLNHVEFALFFFLSLCSFRRGLQHSSWWFICSGFLGGLAFLTRYVGLLYFPVIGVYVLMERGFKFYRGKGIYLAFSSFFVPVLPWSLFSDRVYQGCIEFVRVALVAIPTDDITATLKFAGLTVLELTPILIFFLVLGIKEMKRDSFLLSYLFGALLMFILLKYREPRFVIDFLPGLALAAGVYASSIYEKRKKIIYVLFFLLFLQSVGETLYTSQFELHIKEAGAYISKSPIEGAVVANEEAQIFYYTQRKVYSYPSSPEELENLLEEDIAFLVINQCAPPPYFHGGFQYSQEKLVFTSQKGCGALVYSVKTPLFNLL